MSDMQWTTSWDSVLFYDDQLLPNSYTLTIYFDITTDDANEQNIAFDRMKFFIDKVLQDSIFCTIDGEQSAYFQRTFKQRLVTFVQEPQDMTVIATLYAKLTSIVEGRINIEKIQLSSLQGSGIVINFDEEFAAESKVLTNHDVINAADKTPWWFRTDCGSADVIVVDEVGGTATFITDVTGWEDADLLWSDKEGLRDVSRWNPTIIPGGKTIN